ncbi:sugar ABC transporter substrate-binding protein [Cohnella sp. LGH]|uniref:ABC transporter substrate-binding protein n=1 Tax=Cohnella sp. LGH TaxID=1619153 RepID=UPI001ADC26F1|nr:sugar ABC transporter substrate-binding protein [Cohnella sp. LGH]QTH42406.1 sugar ABC transporter substrate-binding protein [Cohnella sp. LGH]
MKKLFGIAASAILLAGVTTACGSGNNGDSTGTPAPSGSSASAESSPSDSTNDKFTLKVVASDLKGDGLDVATEMFKQKYPNAEVQVVTGGWGSGGQDLRNKQLILLSGGESADVGKMIWGKEFFRSGVIDDITEAVKSWEVYDRLSDGQKDRMMLDGKVYGVTFSSNTVYMFYNKDILAQAGFNEAPKTLDDLAAIAKKIKEANLQTADGKPIYATSFEGGNWATDYWLWANGGKQMTDDYSKTLIDSPESIQAYQFMQDFVNNGWAPKIDGSYDQLWLNGQVAVWFCGDWDIPATINANINAGYAPMPQGSSGLNTTSVGGVEWAVFKQSKRKKEALDFIEILVSKEFQLKTQGLTTDLALYDDPELQATWKADGTFEGRMAEKVQLQNTKYNFLEAPFLFPDASKIYNAALEKILIGGADVTATMKEAAEQINKGIAEASNS